MKQRKQPYLSSCTLVLFLLVYSNAFAQDTTSRRHSTRYVTEYEIDRNQPFLYLDTSMNETEIFHTLYQKLVIFQDLGNIGSPGRSLFFTPGKTVGFNGAFNPYEHYWMNRQQARYYNTTRPYTEIFYTQGAEELLSLKVKHYQNILPRWNAGIDFQRLTSQGFFIHEKTSHYNTLFNTRYQSKNKRYDLIASAIWNRGYNDENGGIINDSAFEALTGANKSVNVNMITTRNRYRNRSFMVKQYYRFGSTSSSIRGEDTLYDFRGKAQLAYTIRTDETSYTFLNNGDSLNPLLPNQYYATAPYITYDSLYNGLVENKFQVQLFANDPNRFKRFLSFGIAHQAAVVSQAAYLRNFQNVIAEAQAEWINFRSNSISIWLDGAYVLSGFNSNNYKLSSLMRYRLGKFDFYLGITDQLYTPDYNMLKFASNQFIWDNNFEPTHVATQQFVISSNRFRHNFYLTVHHHLVTDYTYLNTSMLPEQASGNASVFQVKFNKTFQAGKFFFKHTLYYQESNASYIPVPEFGGMARYYFESDLFVSKIQLGVDLFYNSSYHAMAWSPASRMFFLQNQITTGNYPLADIFFSMQIKRAVLYAKFEHANQNLIREGFYSTPHYPLSLQAFRIGVRWRIYD